MKKIFLMLFLLMIPIVAQADYVPRFVKRTTDVAIFRYALVKVSTTAEHVTIMTTTDNANLVTGIAQNASAGAGVVINVMETQGLESNVISDGVAVINPGDAIQPSTTINGDVTKGTSGVVCTATTGAVAVAGTQFRCL